MSAGMSSLLIAGVVARCWLAGAVTSIAAQHGHLQRVVARNSRYRSVPMAEATR
ncbi:hypothetical protein ACIRCZ_19435 [Leifsonia sp. NPDC102414]|uniref:hypothetical protein n=1 Tax=Leifsonia sp. NPDC102414 TaxID=3364124 RepID=UPI003817A84E